MTDTLDRPKVSSKGTKAQFTATAGAICRAIEAVRWDSQKTTFGISITDPYSVEFSCCSGDGSAVAALHGEAEGSSKPVSIAFAAARAAFGSIPSGLMVTAVMEKTALVVRYNGGEREIPFFTPKDAENNGLLATPVRIASKSHEWPFTKAQNKALREHIVPAMATDVYRKTLCGACFIPEHGKVVATDTHRLSIRKFEGIARSAPDFIVPAWVLTRTGAEDFVLHWSDGNVWTRIESGTVTVIYHALAVKGTYPAYERVIPTDFTRFLVVDSKTIVEAIRRIAPVAKGNANRMRISVGPNLLTDADPTEQALILSARAADFGSAKESIPTKEASNLSEFQIALNCKYLSDTVKGLASNSVTVEMRASDKPVVVRSTEDPNAFTVIMPMALE